MSLYLKDDDDYNVNEGEDPLVTQIVYIIRNQYEKEGKAFDEKKVLEKLVQKYNREKEITTKQKYYKQFFLFKNMQNTITLSNLFKNTMLNMNLCMKYEDW